MPEAPMLVATVTVVFDGADATPEDVATALLGHEDVTTVRINGHGHASGYRVDVAAGGLEEASEQAGAIARVVADELALRADVVSVGLVRDADRVEVFRVGEAADDLVWGAR